VGQKKSWIGTHFEGLFHFKKFLIIIFIFPIIYFFNWAATAPANIVYIRANQVGYLPGDLKTALILSDYPVKDMNFFIKDLEYKKVVFTGELKKSDLNYGDVKFCYSADFSKLNKPGAYLISFEGNNSYSFKIGKYI